MASEIILNATRRVADKKPFAVSMGSVAGSGGYYVACAGQRIFADSATITGSIGVISGKLVTSGMWSRIGINFKPVQRGEKAGMLSGSELFSEEERDEMQAWMDEVYDVFKGHVVASRGDKLSKPIDDLAGGRVFTGRQAVENGLVDEIGGLEEAIAWSPIRRTSRTTKSARFPAPRTSWKNCSTSCPGRRTRTTANSNWPSRDVRAWSTPPCRCFGNSIPEGLSLSSTPCGRSNFCSTSVSC